jgi:hypothetical protein
MWMINVLSAGVATSVAMITAGFATWINPSHATAIYLGVFLALAAAAILVCSRLLGHAGRAWDALWDEHGRSWAVLEAERIAAQATAPPELPPPGGEIDGHGRPEPEDA